MISAFVGWGTNVVAVQMMFYPVDFVGVRPIGWQGIVPAHARALAARSTELITEKLINLRTIFDGFDPASFAEGNLDKAIEELTKQVVDETVVKHAAKMWQNLDDNAKRQIRTMVRTEVEGVTINILQDISDRIEDIIDLKSIVVEAADRDRRMIGDMFQSVGAKEFAFIKRSGAYFGLAFGLVQMVAWAIYPAYWVLPLFGFMVGYLTNWLAIKLIFEPAEPKKVGPFVLHGLFHKRQAGVAKQFAELVSNDILNPDTIVAKMIEGEQGVILFGIVEKRVDELLEKYRQHPMAKTAIPEDEWPTLRNELFQRIRDQLAAPGGFLHTFTSRAVNVYGQLLDRMTELDSESFEGVLRPAFQKDEWKLILAGAALGTGAGFLQVIFLFGDAVTG